MRPSRFHLSISLAFLRNFLFATPSLRGFSAPLFDRAKTYPQRPEKNGYMWYASPFVPWGTAMAMLSAPLRLYASASLSSCANVFGTFTARVFTTRTFAQLEREALA